MREALLALLPLVPLFLGAITHQSTAGQTFSRVEASPATFTVTGVVVDSGTDYLTVRIGGEGDGTATQAEVSSMTRDGQSGTRLGRAERTDWSWAEIWEIRSPNAGTADLTIVLTESDHAAGRVDGWDGLDTTNWTRTAATATGSSTTASATVSGAASGDVLIDVVAVDGGGKTLTAGANQTGDFTDPGTSGCDVAGSQQAGADGGVMSWTWTGSSPWSIVAVAMIPASGGTPVSREWAVTYDVINSVSREWAVTYDVANQVSREWAVTYDVLNAVSREWAVTYDVANTVSREWALTYDIANSVSREWAVTYDLGSTVSREWAVDYDLLNSVSREWAITYDLGDVAAPAARTRMMMGVGL